MRISDWSSDVCSSDLLARDDLAGEPLGDRGLADPRVAHIERVVLGPPAEDLNRPFDFGVAADQRIDQSLAGFRVQVDAIRFERIAALLCGRDRKSTRLNSSH